jgi:GNAT superfamily N-acetyltransferase
MILTRRPAQPSDMDFARDVHHRAYRDVVVRQFGPWDETAQGRWFNDDWRGHLFEIVICDGNSCGYLSSEERPDSISVREIVLAPEFQGQGIGTSILKEIIERASGSGRPILLRTQHQNRALNLYLRLGFREIQKTDTHTYLEWVSQRS